MRWKSIVKNNEHMSMIMAKAEPRPKLLDWKVDVYINTPKKAPRILYPPVMIHECSKALKEPLVIITAHMRIIST